MARALRPLFVDVDPARREEIADALDGAGWSLTHASAVAGTEAFTAALARRGWDVVIYGGEGADPVPARKATALVRVSDPQLPFVAAVPSVRSGDLSAFIQGFGPDALFAPDPARLPEVLGPILARRLEERGEGNEAYQLLLAQQAITDHVAAGLEPDELCARVLGTLGETLGWTYGAVWRPEGDAGMLRCAALWHDPGADPQVAAFAEVSRRMRIAPGRGLPGRTYAFRRPSWIADVGADGNMPRSGHAVRAGLTTAVAFPITLAEDCAGVIEFFSRDIGEPDAQIAAMFATVAGQLAQYLERRRLQADESRRVEQMLRAERDRAQRYLDVAGTMIVVLDAEARVLLLNRKGCAVLGRDERDVLGHDWFELAVPKHERDAARAVFAQLMAGDESAGGNENAVVTLDGQRRTIAWHSTILRDADGTVVGTLSSGEDVTERLAAEQQITYLAYHDPLTGLGNQALLAEHLKLALARSRRTGAGVALLHLDIDNFKLVNDSLGHRAGDELLCRLAVRLQESIRATDMLARAGGDNFLLLLADLHDDVQRAAERVAAQVGACLAEPFEVAGAEFQISASTGIALAPRDARDSEALLAHADSAMYQAKETARGAWAGFVAAGRDPLERLSMAARLRRALANEEFQLHYQPIFAADGPLAGVEALLRWHDPERGGLVSPAEFIPVAEDTGLIESIGDWVIGAVCEQQVAWAGRGHEPQISVNVSPRQLRRLDFIPRVREHLARTGADPARITVELTETAMHQDAGDPEPVLRALHDLGLQLALDDFGSGYSSLSRLREMPMQTLKIDRAFLRQVPENREAAAIVTAILSLARALGRSTVAEGVETEAQRDFLLEQECPLLQGFLLARPMPVDEVEALMSAEPAAA